MKAEEADLPPKKEGNKAGQAQLMSMSLKSRKDLINAIQSGKTLQAINKLNLISLLLLVSVIVLSSVEYGLFLSGYQGLLSNTNVFIQSIDLNSQIAQAVENTRNLILLNGKSLTTYENYTTAAAYETAVRAKLFTIQTTIDQTQKQMADLAKTFNSLNSALILSNSVNVLFKTGNQYTSQYYNLLESIIMLNSYIIKVANTNLNLVVNSDDDVYFIQANGLNSIYAQLNIALAGMQNDMQTYSSSSLSKLLIVLIVTAFIIIIGGFLLIPYLNNVQKAKEEILMLFLQIKKNYAKNFAKQCQLFYNSLQKKRNREKSGSEGEVSEGEEEHEDEEEDEGSEMLPDQRNYSQFSNSARRRLANQSGNIISSILCVLFFGLLASCYFVFSYVFFGVYLFDSISLLNNSFQEIATLNSAYFLDYISVREMILNSTWKIQNSYAYSSSQIMINNLTNLQETVKYYFYLDSSELSLYFGGFLPTLDPIIDGSLCSTPNDYFTDSTACSAFAHSIASKVF